MKPTRKELSAVFLRAAERIAAQRCDFACTAIVHAATSYKQSRSAQRAFGELFKPKGISIHEPWFGDPLDEHRQAHRTYRAHRVLALCLAAAIYEDK